MYTFFILLLLCKESATYPSLTQVFDYEMLISTLSMKDKNPVREDNLSGLRSFPFSVLYTLPGKEIILFWDVDKTEGSISFKVRIPLSEGIEKCGFLGFGFSDRGDQYNADAILVSWTKENVVHSMDTFTDKFGVLRRDVHNDYIMEYFQIGLENNEQFVEIIFRRPLNTHDWEDYKIEWGTTHIFILFGENKPDIHQYLNFDDVNFVGGPLSLLRKEMIPSGIHQNTFQTEFTLHKVNVPAVPTTYWCHTLERNVSRKVHGVQYESLVTPDNKAVVHHIILYHCEVPCDQHLPSYSGRCSDKPAQLTACSKVIAAWAMGAGPLIYPAEAGVPIGGPEWSSYFMLEVHYNNPLRVSGLVDSSGIKFYVTENLRKYSVGILEVGVTYAPNLVIPPGEGEFELSGICLPNCTSSGLPLGGIHVFASQLHAHLSGRAIQTRHFRDGEELHLLDKDPHFTMSFQDIRLLPEDVVILPGDALVTSCTYNTRDRLNVTLGGFGTMDEMCVNYLHYYPKASLEVCKSTLSERALTYFFEENLGSDQLSNNQMTTEEKFSAIKWTKKTKEFWKQMTRTGPLDEECLQSNGNHFPGNWKNIMGTSLDQADASRKNHALHVKKQVIEGYLH
ncbi:Dopamine beta-hydroxylase [Holothuria leucospilota]|uniref:Dopamine beta-hydroxylase n=1 Tax=Holothuria leucospilota TaxID=206669 RepID=A0A9Q1HAH1_HOLLE|nr:Dopamine beta-hydroxylase [Holothuria leucospilota]